MWTSNPDKTQFGVTPDGEVVERVTLHNAAGMQVDVISLGASLQGVQVPDREGRLGHVLLGHDTLEPYLSQPHFMGACVGRYANRIGGAAFTLDGRDYSITANEGPNALHGGARGLDKVVWRIESADQHQVVLSHVSSDGDQGFPGELTITATYRLARDQNHLDLILEAATDAPTVVSLAPHGYFNLAGADGDRDVMDHQLTLAASAYTPVDEGLIPTGEIRPVEGTPFDFRTPRSIGDRVRTALPPPAGRLAVEGAVVRYADDGPPQLKGASVTLEPGQTLGVIGPSGSGKTTLARVIAGAVAPAAGAVRLDGAEYAAWDSDALARHIG